MYNGSKTIVDIRKDVGNLKTASTDLQTQIVNTVTYTYNKHHSGRRNRYLETSLKDYESPHYHSEFAKRIPNIYRHFSRY